MIPNRILALDLGSKSLGWAVSSGKSGKHCLALKQESYREDPGKLWNLYLDWLNSMLRTHRITLLVYEASLHQPGHAARIINGLVALTELACYQKGIAIGSYHQMMIKKHAMGTCKHPKGQSKIAMLAAAKKRDPSRDWQPEDHDEIDALFLLDLAIHDGQFLPQGSSFPRKKIRVRS